MAILNQNILPSEVLVEMATSLVPALLSLLDDSVLLTRQISCQSLGRVVSICSGKLDPELTNKIYPGRSRCGIYSWKLLQICKTFDNAALLKRLDDVSNDVRLEACEALECTFSNLSSKYDPEFYKLHIAAVVSALIIHLDDDKEEIRDVIYGTISHYSRREPL